MTFLAFYFFKNYFGTEVSFTPEQPKTAKDFVLGSYVYMFLYVYVW